MRIATIVVTYNRSKLLIECLDNICNQTLKPNRVYIIDNASTDNTFEELEANKYMNEINNNIEFIYFRMEKNTGGAGGFNKGLKTAFDDGYDVFWLMDDDGIPEKTCLESLIRYVENYDFISPLVLSTENKDLLSFGIKGTKDKKEIYNKYDKVAEGVANPFNGVLFTRNMIEKIGFPKKEMFIWGDEIEYQYRASKNNIKIATILDAIHYHPENRIKNYNILFGKVTINYPEGKLRQYCLFRNYIYTIWNYGSKLGFIRWMIVYTYFFVIYRKLDISGLRLFIEASIDGIKKDFSKHEIYI